MFCLSIDTTAKTASVCLSRYNDGLLLPVCESTLNGALTHSETLLPMIDRVLELSGNSIDDISVIALSAGPGSFTGVRIGTSAAKGLSFSLTSRGIKHYCVPVSSLEALANNACVPFATGAIICPVMDARRSQVYNALFEVDCNGKLVRICEDRLIGAEELCAELDKMPECNKVALLGDGTFVAKKVFDTCLHSFELVPLHGGFIYQRAFSVANTAFEHFDDWHGKYEEYSGAILAPVYLRASQAERELEEKKLQEK